MIVLTPPTSFGAHLGPKVFLAGSIEMGLAVDWQSDVAKRLSSLPGVIFNPRRPDWDLSWKQTKDNPQFREQVLWELDGLDRADLIPMYYAPDTKSPISLLENGLYAASGKMVIYCPEGFWRKGNVDIVAERYHIPVFENYDKWLDHIAAEVLYMTVTDSWNLRRSFEK